MSMSGHSWCKMDLLRMTAPGSRRDAAISLHLLVICSLLISRCYSSPLDDVSSSDRHVTPGDPRYVTSSELSESMEQFSSPRVGNFSHLLFDVRKYQLIAGATDHLFRLSVEGLQQLDESHWPAPYVDQMLCVIKGQPVEECRNYMRLLHRSGDRLLACGTSAFQPQCSWRRFDVLDVVVSNYSGVALSPYSPRYSVASLLTRDGDLLSATTTDFSGNDPALFRPAGPTHGMLRTAKFDSKLFNQPSFVGSFETDDFAFFVFREQAVEHMACGKVVYSRIARVCKNDVGSRNRGWTTFVKARLNCSLPGEIPYYLDHVQSVHYLPSEELLYATFNTQPNGVRGSAVCVYRLSDVQRAFSGAFRHQSSAGGPWQRVDGVNASHLQCGSPRGSSDHRLLQLAQYSLMYDAVQPVTGRPLYFLQGVRLTDSVTALVSTKHHAVVHVIFTADERGVVRKLSVVPKTQRTCLIELLHPFNKPTNILTMKLLQETSSLYLGTDSAVVRVPVHRCGRRYSTERQCLQSGDPYCGWDSVRSVCSPAPGRNPDVASWRQSVTQCPAAGRAVDGGWTDWTDWAGCVQTDDGGPDTACRCRRRTCELPAPANGGLNCNGTDIQVTNCTRHGGWTSWSSWSSCSSPCGPAFKRRRRGCSSPTPAHGGRSCSGQPSQQLFCAGNPPCPASRLPTAAAAVDGGWGNWSAWGLCSAACGGGFHERRRVCDSPRPGIDGAACAGCPVEYSVCNVQPCPRRRTVTDWTPWMYAVDQPLQRRFRFYCSAAVADQQLITGSPAEPDERRCDATGVCTESTADGVGWGSWSAWSDCSALCGGGERMRTRLCEGDPADCLGSSSDQQLCNTQTCNDQWGCWTEWSACSGGCDAVGQRTRSRTCRRADGSPTTEQNCDGAATIRQPCRTAVCLNGTEWTAWSVWGLCDERGEQQRTRWCAGTSCKGPRAQTQTRLCSAAMEGLRSERDDWLSPGQMAAGCVSCFCAGALLSALFVYRCTARVPRGTSSSSSSASTTGSCQYYTSVPHHTITSVPNHYVTMGGVTDLHELAERRTHGSPALCKLPSTAGPVASTFRDASATIRRGGSDLKLNLHSDAIY